MRRSTRNSHLRSQQSSSSPSASTLRLSSHPENIINAPSQSQNEKKNPETRAARIRRMEALESTRRMIEVADEKEKDRRRRERKTQILKLKRQLWAGPDASTLV